MSEKENVKGEKALKAGVWYTISSVAVKAMAIITTPIYTRLLTTGDYGTVQTFTTWYALLQIFCSLNLTWSVGNAKQDFKNKTDEYVGSLQLFSILFTVLLSLGTFFLWPGLENLFDMSPLVMLIMAIYLVTGNIVGLEQTKFRFQYKYKENIAITVFISVATVLVSVPMILGMKTDRYLGRIIGIVLPMVCLGILFTVSNLKRHTWALKKNYIIYGLKISVPLILHTVSLNILAQSDRLVIAKYGTSSDVGVYSLAYQYAILINVFLNAINEAWLPWFQDQYAVGNFETIRQKVKPMILFGCYMSIGCAAVAPEAILILGGKSYIDGVWVVPPILMGLLCQFLYTRYVHVELQEKKTGIISTGTMVAAAVNLILNFIFVPKYGFVAAGYTTFFSYIVLFAIHFIITTVILKKKIYNDAYMIVSMLLTIAVIGGMAALYQYIVIRYLVIVTITIVYFMTNKEFIMQNFGNKILKRHKDI